MTLLLALSLMGAGPGAASGPGYNIAGTRAPRGSLMLAPPQQQAPKLAPKAVHRKPVTHYGARRAAGISPARARQIQDALIAAGYLTRASGRWDAATLAAMKRFQAQHDWQTRYLPDARALIALGLGPAQPSSTAAAPAPPGDGRGRHPVS